MKRTMLTVGALLIGTVATAHAKDAQKQVDPTKMTCAEFVALEDDAQPRVVAWLAGYSDASKDRAPTVVPIVAKEQVEVIRQECRGEPTQSLWDKIRAKLPGGRKANVEPAKMTCQQFVELGEAVQPAVAYYLHGYAGGGTQGATQGVKGAGASRSTHPSCAWSSIAAPRPRIPRRIRSRRTSDVGPAGARG